MESLPPLPNRDPKGHKGTFGTVAVVGGQTGAGVRMVGGPCLSALAALRSGAGLVRLAMPDNILSAGLVLAPGATGVELPTGPDRSLVGHATSEAIDRLLGESTCMAIGPGLGVSDGARAASLRAVVQDDTPVVVDADALNNLAQIPELQRDFHAPAVVTPHPGEYARLAAALRIHADPKADAQRPEAAEKLAQILGCVVVLKGARTVVSDGHRSWTNDSTCPALGTAGTGDVLTGMIAALIAQQHKRPIPAGSRTVTSEQRGGLGLFDCARLAVRAHALAAAAWCEQRAATGGMLATDLLDLLPPALESLRAR